MHLLISRDLGADGPPLLLAFAEPLETESVRPTRILRRPSAIVHGIAGGLGSTLRVFPARYFTAYRNIANITTPHQLIATITNCIKLVSYLTHE